MTKLTTITVEKIPCYCSIGIDPEERKMGQQLLVDISVDIDSNNAISSDNINDTFSYVDIYKTVQKIATSKPHSLIEALAEDIALVLLKHSLVSKAKIKLHKPHIPYKDFQGNVSVEIERRK